MQAKLNYSVTTEFFVARLDRRLFQGLIPRSSVTAVITQHHQVAYWRRGLSLGSECTQLSLCLNMNIVSWSLAHASEAERSILEVRLGLWEAKGKQEDEACFQDQQLCA